MDYQFKPIIKTRSQRANEKLPIDVNVEAKCDKVHASCQTEEMGNQPTPEYLKHEEILKLLKKLEDGQASLLSMVINLQLKKQTREKSTEYIHNSTNDLQSLCGFSLNKDLPNIVHEMKTTIEVLEMENTCLKNELANKSRFDNEWKVPKRVYRNNKIGNHHQKTFSQTITKNRFDILSKEDTQSGTLQENEGHEASPIPFKRPIKNKYPQNEIYTKHHISKPKNTSGQKLNKSIHDVHLFTDSHGRGLSELLRKKLPGTNIMSFCKPGAKFLNVLPKIRNLKKNQCIFLMAGTNDISVGESDILTKNLPTTLDYLSQFNVIVSTIPLRHDLDSNHPINEEIMYFNAYLKDLTKTKSNIKIMDVSFIDRKYFTQHGLHLNYRGKVLISHLLLQALASGENSSNLSKDLEDNWKKNEDIAETRIHLRKNEDIAETRTPSPPTSRQDKSYSEAVYKDIDHQYFLETSPLHNIKHL